MAQAKKVGEYGAGKPSVGTDVEATFDSVITRVNNVTLEQQTANNVGSTQIIDNSVTLVKIPDGVFTADTAGRAKFADKIVTRAKQEDEALGAGSYMRLIHEVGGDGGSSSNAIWNDRNLNVISDNPQSIAVAFTTGGKFRLPIGTYKCQWIDIAYQPNGHKTRFRNVDDNVVLVKGTSGYVTSGDEAMSSGAGEFVVSNSAHEHILEHYTQTGRATFGMGRDSGASDTEIYSIFEMWKIG